MICYSSILWFFRGNPKTSSLVKSEPFIITTKRKWCQKVIKENWSTLFSFNDFPPSSSELNSSVNLWSKLMSLVPSLKCTFTFTYTKNYSRFLYSENHLLSYIWLHFQLFIYIFSYLFTFSAIYLHFQLFVYIFSYLFTFTSILSKLSPPYFHEFPDNVQLISQ